jgi:hypothetical protein
MVKLLPTPGFNPPTRIEPLLNLAGEVGHSRSVSRKRSYRGIKREKHFTHSEKISRAKMGGGWYHYIKKKSVNKRQNLTLRTGLMSGRV